MTVQQERPSRRRYNHVVSFRLDDDAMMRAEALRSSMPDGTWAEVGRWLFGSEASVEMIGRRVRGEIE